MSWHTEIGLTQKCSGKAKHRRQYNLVRRGALTQRGRFCVSAMKKISGMTWSVVYQDKGLRWEKVSSIQAPQVSIRFTRSASPAQHGLWCSAKVNSCVFYWFRRIMMAFIGKSRGSRIETRKGSDIDVLIVKPHVRKPATRK